MSSQFSRFSNTDEGETVFPGRSSTRFMRRFWWVGGGAIVLAMFIGLIVVSVKCKTKDISNSNQMCLTEECIYVSASILSKMNQDIDPCTDMYTFACGGWLKNIEVLHPRQEWSLQKEIELNVQNTLMKLLKTGDYALQGKNSTAIKKLKKLYQQCMDEERINQGLNLALQFISDLGSWTLTTYKITPWNSKTWSLQISIEQMHMMNINCLFTLSINEETDDDDNSIFILQFQNSGLTLNVNDYTDDEYIAKFKLMFYKFATYLNDNTSSIPSKKLDEVVSFESQLAQIVIESQQEDEKIIQLQDLQDLFSPWLNVSQYLTALFSGIQISNGTKVSIITPGYFNRLKDLIKATKKEVLANYIMWNFINSITDALPRKFNAEKERLSYIEAQPRSEMCVNKAVEILDLAVTALYVDNNFQFNNQSKLKVSVTVQEITNEIVANLNNFQWLDYRTRNYLHNKSVSLKYNIGYPDWIMNVDKLDKYYGQLILNNDSYLDTFLVTFRYRNSKELELLWKSPDQEPWIQSPIAGAPFYFNQTVYITTGYLQPPFYDPTLPIPFYYGSVGFSAAQEILHDFHTDDDWSQPSKSNYLNKAKCFKDQYDKYIVQGQPMNSTLDEYIFDNGAVHQIYQLYKQKGKQQKIFPGLNLTEDQLFFLGFSQSMCSVYAQPSDTVVKDFSTNEMYRVIGSLSNSMDFTKAFNCPVNSAMNPENKCQLW